MIFLLSQILEVGDVLRVDVLGYEYSFETFIEPDGRAFIPMHGYVQLEKLTLEQARDSLQSILKANFPLAKVYISIVNRLKPVVFVVSDEGSSTMDYFKGMRLEHALAMASVPKDRISSIRILREGRYIEVPKDSDVRIEAYDIVYVKFKKAFPLNVVLQILNLTLSILTLLSLLGVI